MWMVGISNTEPMWDTYMFALKEIQEDRYADRRLSQFPSSFSFLAFDGSDTFGTTISSIIWSRLPGASIFDGRMIERWSRVVDLSPFCPYIKKSCITSTWNVISFMNFILKHCKHGLENDWHTQIVHYTVKVRIQAQSMYKLKWNLRLKFYSLCKLCGYYDVNSKKYAVRHTFQTEMIYFVTFTSAHFRKSFCGSILHIEIYWCFKWTTVSHVH